MNNNPVGYVDVKRRKVKLQIIMIFLYFIAASIMTFPLLFNFNTSIYGIGHDNLGELWNIWAKQKIVRESIDPNNFTYTNHPFGMDVNNRVIIYTYELILWFVSIVSPNALFGFNLHLFLKSILAAWFMYLLLIYITKDKMISWIGGFFYVYSPYFLAMNQAYGPGVMPSLLPLFFLYLLKFFENRRIVYFIILILVYILLFGENYYYGYFISITMVFVFIIYTSFYIVIKERRKRILSKSVEIITKHKIKLIQLSVVLAVIGGVSIFYTYDLVGSHIQNRKFDMSEAFMRSAKPYFYLTPSIGNILFSQTLIEYIWENSGDLEVYENAIYLGWIPIIIVCYTLWRRKFLSGATQKYFSFFLIVFICSIVLAQGPYIPFDVDAYTHHKDIESYPHLKAPSFLFFKIAPMFRFITRYHAITICCTVVCFIIGFQYLLSIIPSKIFRKIFFIAVVFGVFCEYSNFPPSRVLEIYELMPEAYKYLAEDKEDYAILEIPNKSWPVRAHLLAFQTMHGKRIFGGNYGYFNEDILDPKVQLKFKKQNFKYVVISTTFPRVTYPPMQVWWPDFSQRGFPRQKHIGYLELKHEFSDSLIFEIKNDFKFEKIIFSYLSGFEGEMGPQQPHEVKWMTEKRSECAIYSGEDIERFSLNFTARSLHVDRELTIYLNGERQNSIFVKAGDHKRYQVILNNLKKEKNSLSLVTKARLANIQKTLGTTDNRDVAIEIGRFAISEKTK